ncbi:MAG: S8/S53 family peptidase [Spirosomataceae bacterium]
MKKITRFVLLMLVAAACQQQDEIVSNVTNPSNDLVPTDQIDTFVLNTIKQTQQPFEWKSAPDNMVWSALVQSEKVLSVGYRNDASNKTVEENLHTININDADWTTARNQLLTLIFEEERKTNADLKKPEDLIVYQEEILPVLDVHVENFSTIQKLRQHGLVRYAEPMGYKLQIQNRATRVAGSSGCGSNNAEPGLVNGTHYTVDSPSPRNGKISWNYSYHSVQSAWGSGYSGQGVKVAIIDTGSSDTQENIVSAFNQGASSGRTVERRVTLPRSTFLGIPTGPVETPNDGCGHGTSMAGACAAPRGIDGNTVGIAYSCNLVVTRAAEDVFLDASREQKGVADAFTWAGGQSSVKIISMSMGNIFSSSQISDAVKYAYNQGKMIFCAAGTSFDWTAGFVGVIFPASMAEAIAVTGVKDNLNTRCDACHQGSDVEFVTVMEKSDGQHPLSLAMSGDAPSTVGGSSVATASMAGMAAIVWSKYPTANRTTIYNRLKNASSNASSRNANFGWGRVNVATALL